MSLTALNLRFYGDWYLMDFHPRRGESGRRDALRFSNHPRETMRVNNEIVNLL